MPKVRFAVALAVLCTTLGPVACPILNAAPAPAAPAHPLGTAEKYTFANPHTPLKDIKTMANLSDDQAAKIAATQAATEKTVADFQAANAAQLKAAHDALVAADQGNNSAAKVKAAQAVRDLEKPMTDAWEKARFDILAVMTPDQVQSWRKAIILNSARFTYAKANLTPEELTQIGAIYDQLAQQPGATFESINAKVSQRIPPLLSPEQKQAMSLGTPRPGKTN